MQTESSYYLGGKYGISFRKKSAKSKRNFVTFKARNFCFVAMVEMEAMIVNAAAPYS